MRGKITKRSVDGLKLAGRSELTLWDTDLRGFGIRVRSGGARTYIVRYRPGAGGRSAPLRTVTIGRHGSPWTPDAARNESRRILGLVAAGADPASDHFTRRTAPTVADLAKRFIAEHADAKCKARTAHEYRRLIEKFVLTGLGSRKVGDVTRQDIARIHHRLRNT